MCFALVLLMFNTSENSSISQVIFQKNNAALVTYIVKGFTKTQNKRVL